MKNFNRLGLGVLIVMFFAVGLVFGQTKKVPSKNTKLEKAIAFSLKDQHNKIWDFNFPREKVTILAFGDKDGAEQMESWVVPLGEKYGEKVDIQGIAELSIVPGIAKAMVRGQIKKRAPKPVLLDWSGNVSKDYGYEKAKANIFLIKHDGSIIAKYTGAADKTQLDKIIKQIDELLK